MKNLNVSEKFKRGIVLFAFNSGDIDYVHIAVSNARLIKKYLGLPVSLVTDRPLTSQIASDHFDHVTIFENDYVNYRMGYDAGSVWRNGYRYIAYEVTPFEETILLDTDYLVFDNSLLKLLDTVNDYQIMQTNQDFNGPLDTSMGRFSLNYLWATVVAFKKTKKASQLFQLVGRIQSNWEYFTQLYSLRQTNFRNDHAFAIANHVLNGYSESKENVIPWTMLTAIEPIKSIEIEDDRMTVRESERAFFIPKQNLHIIDKKYLASDEFQLLVHRLCNT